MADYDSKRHQEESDSDKALNESAKADVRSAPSLNNEEQANGGDQCRDDPPMQRDSQALSPRQVAASSIRLFSSPWLTSRPTYFQRVSWEQAPGQSLSFAIFCNVEPQTTFGPAL